MDQFLNNIKSSGAKLTIAIVLLGILVFSTKSFYIPQIFSVSHLFNINISLLNGSIWFIAIGLISLIFFSKYRYTYLEFLMISLLIYSILSGVWAINLASNLAANAILITLFLIYLFLKHFIRSRGENSTDIISKGISIMTILVCFHYLVFNAENILNISSGRSYQNEIKYLQSFVGGKNETGILLALSIPFIFFNLLNRKNTWLSVLSLLICAGTILVTGCRSAYLALFIFFLGMGLQYKFTKKQLIFGGISFAVVMGVFLNIVGVKKFADQILRNSLQTRKDIWANLLDIFATHNPLTGIGTGQWYVSKDQFSMTKHLHPHNDALSYLVELGGVGLILFGAILGVFIFRLYKTKKTDNITSWYWVNIILIAAFTSTFILFNFDELKFKLNHSTLMFLIWAFISFRFEETLEEKHFINKNIGNFFTVVFALLVLCYGIVLTQQSKVFKQVQTQRNVSNWEELLVQKNNLIFPLVNQIGKEPAESYVHQAYVELKRWQERLNGLDQVALEFPYHINNNERLAFFYLNEKRYKEALTCLDRIAIQKPCLNSIPKMLQQIPVKDRTNKYDVIMERTKKCRINTKKSRKIMQTKSKN